MTEKVKEAWEEEKTAAEQSGGNFDKYKKSDGDYVDAGGNTTTDPSEYVPDYDKYKLTQDMFDGTNSFISYVGNSSNNVYRESNCIEIKGKGLEVTFEGTGTLTITFRSTGSGNTSTIALIDSKGNYIQGAVDQATVGNETVTKKYLEGGGYYYEITDPSSGAGFVTITFTITGAGTYTITTSIEKSNNVSSASDDRATRIQSITMVDYYVEDENEAKG